MARPTSMPTPAAPKPYCQPTFSPSVPAISGEIDDTGADEDVINLKRVGASVITHRVEAADLTREVSLETTDTDEKQYQSDKKGDVESYEKLAGRHEQCTERLGATKKAIGQESAADRREVNETGVKTE